jgi:hypothetical protein
MRAVLAVVACVAALLLTASSCSDDPYGTLPPTTPATSPPSTTSPPTSNPTSPPAPTLPALATQDSPAGAESFARFWLTALDYAYQTGNTKPLRSLGNCRGCIALADSVDMVYNKGGHIDGGRIRVTAGKTVQLMPGKAALVRVDYSQADGVTIFPDGRQERVSGSTRLAFLFTLSRSVSSWKVTAIKPIKESN